jgi:hypothetical protein
MSLVNTTGQHVPLLMMAQHPAIGMGQSSTYPHQEGSFFGNIFESPPRAYYCGGRDFTVDVVPGRIGAAQTNAPYVNPFGAGGLCDKYCTPADYPYAKDGYKACTGWNRAVTIWRK